VRFRGEKRSSERQEGVSDRAERRVMVEASPPASLEVVEADLLLQLLVVALDAPPQLRPVRISVHGDRRFRSMAITCFGRWRSPISEHGDHLFRRMTIA